VGSSLGGAHREDDHESTDGRDFAHQVHRRGQRWTKWFPYKPGPRRYIYGLGTRRRIKNTFKASATIEEIMEVLKLGVVQGVQTSNVGVTLLTEELERNAAA
jgi:hypothetical protein